MDGWPHSSTGQMRRVPSSLPVQGEDPKTMELLHNINGLHNCNFSCVELLVIYDNVVICIYVCIEVGPWGG